MALKKKRLLVIIALFIFVFCPLLLVGVYFFATSSYFLTAIALPRAGKAAGVELQAKSIDFSPMSGKLKITGLTAGPTADPVLRCGNLSLHCDLFSLPGKIKVYDLTVSDTDLTLAADKDGRWNLALLNPETTAATTKEKPVQPKPAAPAAKFELPYINISRIAISNVNLKMSSAVPGKDFAMKVSNLNFNTVEIAPGKAAKLDLNGIITFKQNTINVENCRLNCAVTADLNDKLFPTAARLNVIAADLQGKINDLELKNNTVLLDGELVSKGNDFELKTLQLRQKYQDKTISQLDFTTSGTITPLKLQFNLAASKLPPFLLKIIEQRLAGYQIGQAGVTSEGHFSMDGGTVTSAIHTILSHQPTGTNAAELPSLRLEVDHDLSFNTVKQQLDVRKMMVNLSDSGRQTLSLRLSEAFSWSINEQNPEKIDYPSVKLNIDRMPLSYLNIFMQKNNITIPAGTLNANINTIFDRQEKHINVKGTIDTAGLNVTTPSYSSKDTNLHLDFNTKLKEMKEWELSSLNFQVRHNTVSEALLRLYVTGKGNIPDGQGDFAISIDKISGRTLAALPPDIAENQTLNNIIAAIEPFTLALTAAGKFNLKANTLTVNTTVIDLNRNQAGRLTISLGNPMEIDLRNAAAITRSALPINIKAKDFQLEMVNCFLPESFRIKSGTLNASLSNQITLEPQSLTSAGTLMLQRLEVKSGTTVIRNVDLKHELDVALTDNYMTIDISKFESTIGRNNEVALHLVNSGNIKVKEGSLSLNNRIVSGNEMLLSLFLPQPPTAGFGMSGDINLTMSEKYAKQTVKGELKFNRLKTPSFSKPLDASLMFDIYPENNQLCINQIRSSVTDGNRQVTDLIVSGNVAMPLNSGLTDVELKSTCLDVLLLKEIFSPAKTTDTTSSTPAQPQVDAPAKPSVPSEPAPMKIDANVLLRLELDGITYGPELKVACQKSRIRLKNNIVQLEPLTVTVNGSPIGIKGHMDLGQSDGYPFNYLVDFTNLDIAPLVHTFKPDMKQNITGKVNNFKMDLQGKGFTMPNLNRNLAGNIAFETANISYPFSKSDNTLVKVFLITLETFANITTYVPNLSSNSDLSKVITQAGKVSGKANNLKLEKGKVNVQIKDGYAYMQEFKFSGDFIKSFTAGGKIPLENTRPMNVSTNLDVEYLIMPLDIGGTPQAPQANIPKMVAGMVTGNIGNILNSTPIRNIIKGTESNGESLIKTGEKILTEGLFGPSQKSTTPATTTTTPTTDAESSSSEKSSSSLFNILKKATGKSETTTPPEQKTQQKSQGESLMKDLLDL